VKFEFGFGAVPDPQLDEGVVSDLSILDVATDALRVDRASHEQRLDGSVIERSPRMTEPTSPTKTGRGQVGANRQMPLALTFPEHRSPNMAKPATHLPERVVSY